MLGTDAIAGLMLHHEMKLCRARCQDRLDRAGKRADLVVIDGDPLAKLDDIERVVSTVRGGVFCPSAPLYESVGVRP